LDFVFYLGKKRKAEEKENKKKLHTTKIIIRTRRLMWSISKQFKLDRGSKCSEKYILDAIVKIRKLDKYDSKTARMWINRLKRFDFIRMYNVCKVMDTGQDWSELK
jgi:hypothetical protein